jgi:homoserine O-acetyltransferase
MHFFHSNQPFHTEGGATLASLTVAYHTWGTLNAARDNAVWICHALTSNSNAAEWWPGMIGKGCLFDPAKDFIVCANILGSCYGTTGPLSVNPETGAPYYSHFPLLTIRDMVQSHLLLREHLGIKIFSVLVGGSMGGFEALEWALMEPEVVEKLFLLATSAAESAWGIAIHTTQRLAIEADASWKDPQANAGAKGLKAARAIGLLSYRNYQILVEKQTDPDLEKINHFKATSYIHHQGDKLVRRFNTYSYWLLTKAMDTHNVARGRSATIAETLATLSQPTLLIAITSDILCPPQEQQFIARHSLHATLVEIDSGYGHDGFLIESETITLQYRKWLKQLYTETVKIR